MADRVSLRQVAAEAGVSLATASMALAGDQRVAAATRVRVRTVADGMGYVRHPLLASLAGGRFRHAGRAIVIATAITEPVSLPRFRRLAEGMGAALAPLPASAQSRSAILAGAQALGAAALVLNRRGMDAAELTALTMPVVLWEDENPDQPCVDVVETGEWWSATVGALRRLAAAGYRRPGVVLVPAVPRHWHDDVRLAAARAQGVPVLETLSIDRDLPGFIARHRPDALLGGVVTPYEALRRLGLALPFASLLLPEGHWYRSIAGWVGDRDSRFRVTLELIEWRLRYGAAPPRRVIVPPRWRDGASLRPTGH